MGYACCRHNGQLNLNKDHSNEKALDVRFSWAKEEINGKGKKKKIIANNRIQKITGFFYLLLQKESPSTYGCFRISPMPNFGPATDFLCKKKKKFLKLVYSF